MMKWVFSGLIICAVLSGAMNDRMNEVSNAALNECGNAVMLCITLAGTMCMWSGLMKVAQKAKLTERLSALLAPAISFLFNGLDHRSGAAQAITMNLTANFLGLGNAATPLGINAMRELDKTNRTPGVASDHMILFVVLNTASLQLVPTTTALLRSNAGSAAPLDILPAVVCASSVSIIAGVAMAKLLNRIHPAGRADGGGGPAAGRRQKRPARGKPAGRDAA